MSMGCSFHWPAGKHLYLIYPDGMIVKFDVHGGIPYLRSGSKKSAHKNPTREILVPGVSAPVSVQQVAAPIPLSGGNSASGAKDQESEVDDSEALSEVDELDPAAEYSEVEKRDLRAEALSLDHRMSHRTKNPFCDSCVRDMLPSMATQDTSAFAEGSLHLQRSGAVGIVFGS
jgi:hypothetical protein